MITSVIWSGKRTAMLTMPHQRPSCQQPAPSTWREGSVCRLCHMLAHFRVWLLTGFAVSRPISSWVAGV
jgi:hypothetical protein